MDKKTLEILHELEAKKYSQGQINQILKGLEEGNEYIAALPQKTEVEDFRKFRALCNNFKLATNDVASIRVHLEAGGTISMLPEDSYMPETYDMFFDACKKYEAEKILDAYKKAPNASSFELFLKGFDNNIDFVNLLENVELNASDIDDLLMCDAENLEGVCKCLRNGFDNVHVLNELINNLKKSHLKLSLDELSKLNCTSDVLSYIIENGNLTTKDFKLLIKENVPEIFLNALASHRKKLNGLKRDIDFFKVNEKLIDTFNAKKIFNILEVLNLTGKNLEIFANNFNKYIYGEIDVLERLSSSFAYRDSDEKLREKYKDFDIAHFLELKYNYEQKQTLLTDVTRFGNKDFIYKYVNETYSPKQIEELAYALYNGKEIKKACNPDYTIEHMRHIIFYESKGISFKDEEDYDKNYTVDKNKDYDTFLYMYNELTGDDSYRNDIQSKLTEIRWYGNLNKAYGMTINIDAMLTSPKCYFDIVSMSHLIDFCISNKINAGIFMDGKHSFAQMKIIAEAIATGKSYKKFLNLKLSIEKMEEMLEHLKSETSNQNIGETYDR